MPTLLLIQVRLDPEGWHTSETPYNVRETEKTFAAIGTDRVWRKADLNQPKSVFGPAHRPTTWETVACLDGDRVAAIDLTKAKITEAVAREHARMVALMEAISPAPPWKSPLAASLIDAYRYWGNSAVQVVDTCGPDENRVFIRLADGSLFDDAGQYVGRSRITPDGKLAVRE